MASSPPPPPASLHDASVPRYWASKLGWFAKSPRLLLLQSDRLSTLDRHDKLARDIPYGNIASCEVTYNNGAAASAANGAASGHKAAATGDSSAVASLTLTKGSQVRFRFTDADIAVRFAAAVKK